VRRGGTCYAERIDDCLLTVEGLVNITDPTGAAAVSVRRSPLRLSRIFLVVGSAAAVGLLPGTAFAADTSTSSNPADAVVSGVTGAAGTSTGDSGSTGGLTGGTGVLTGGSGGTGGTGGTSAPTTGADQPGTSGLPPGLVAALDQLAAASGVSQQCADGIQASITLIVQGAAEIPAELQAQLEDLLAQLQAMGSAGPPDATSLAALTTSIQNALAGGAAAPTDSKIAQGLQQLADTLSGSCKPAAAVAPPPPQPPGATPTQTAQPTKPPAARQVAYPGYAPTGGNPAQDASGPGPLAALGGVLLLGSATAAAHRRRRRAAPSQD